MGWQPPQVPFPKKRASPRRSASVALVLSSRPWASSFGVGGKSNMFCIWAMWLTWMRSRMFMPFFMARMASPLKYAVRCSNSAKSSTERWLRMLPWICRL